MYKFIYKVGLADTDSASVLFFANQFNIIHLAYESFLDSINLSISTILNEKDYIIPIIHAESDYTAAIRVGDILLIELELTQISDSIFEINYNITRNSKICGKSITRHIVLDKHTRNKVELPEEIKKSCSF